MPFVCKKGKEVILVEGPKDAEKCRSGGIENIVAGMGTALAHEQIQLLKKMNVPVKLFIRRCCRNKGNIKELSGIKKRRNRSAYCIFA